MEKSCYDLVFGFGGACCCSQTLREADLQYASFPFDWLALSTLRKRAEILRDDYADWLSKDALEPYPGEQFGHGSVYHHMRSGLVFAHDFHRNVPFDEEWIEIDRKYRRRQEHLARLLSGSKRVLAVWVNVPNCHSESEADYRYALDIFRTKYPNARIDLLAFEHVDGLAPAAGRDREEDGLRIVGFDYRDRRQADAWTADHKLLGAWMKERYEVVDYRTEAEKTAWKKNRRLKKYRRFNAHGYFEYLVTKFQYKIFSHLRKRLMRKGLI